MIYDSMSSSESVSWPNDRWIKVNVNQTGFYRVNYELANWWKLTEHLKQTPNSVVDQCTWHTNTHTTYMYICTHLSYTRTDMHSVLLGIFFFPQVLTPADRAGLLDDVFALSRCVHSCYKVACSIVAHAHTHVHEHTCFCHCKHTHTCTYMCTWTHCCCHCKHTHMLITFIIYTPFPCSAGHLGVVTAFNLSSYLERERHYLPWSVALSWMHTIGERLSLTPLYGKYKVHTSLPPLQSPLHGISLVNRILTVSCVNWYCLWRSWYGGWHVRCKSQFGTRDEQPTKISEWAVHFSSPSSIRMSWIVSRALYTRNLIATYRAGIPGHLEDALRPHTQAFIPLYLVLAVLTQEKAWYQYRLGSDTSLVLKAAE